MPNPAYGEKGNRPMLIIPRLTCIAHVGSVAG